MSEDIDLLLSQVQLGDAEAAGRLLELHRSRLRRMVGLRMDPRVAARFAPSDVVQEAFQAAIKSLPEYAANPVIPFYPWLRRLAWRRLADLHRRHLAARRRSAKREIPPGATLSDESQWVLASRLVSKGPAPDNAALFREGQARLFRALTRLESTQREVIVLRYLEDLTFLEIAAVLDIAEDAVKMRHLRALKKLRSLLDVGD